MQQAVHRLVRGIAQIVQRACVQILEHRHAAKGKAQHQRVLPLAGHAQGDLLLSHEQSLLRNQK